MDGEGEGAAAVDLLELARPAVEPVELLHAVHRDLRRRLLPVDLLQLRLRVVQDVDALDDLAGVLLEQEDEELVLARLQHVDQSLPLPPVQLPREAHVRYRVYHQLLVRLLRERVLPVLRLDLRLSHDLRPAFFARVLVFDGEDVGVFVLAFAAVVGEHALGGSEGADGLDFSVFVAAGVVVQLLADGDFASWFVVLGEVGVLFGGGLYVVLRIVGFHVGLRVSAHGLVAVDGFVSIKGFVFTDWDLLLDFAGSLAGVFLFDGAAAGRQVWLVIVVLLRFVMFLAVAVPALWHFHLLLGLIPPELLYPFLPLLL